MADLEVGGGDAFFKEPKNTNVTFVFESEECAKIWFDSKTGKVYFEGNLDKSAEIFFEQFRGYVDEYIKERLKNAT